MIWKCQDLNFDLQLRGEIMGILNVTPDSFSDGGAFTSPERALAHAGKMIQEGAAIIDVGGESTRPGAEEVSVSDELARTVNVIAELREQHPEIALSIDTSKPAVARACLESGARILNDVSGFADPEMAEAAAQSGAGIVVMHMQGSPRTMQKEPVYQDVVREIGEFFEERFADLTGRGIAPEQIVFDPGIGFGKTVAHNLALLRNLDQLTAANRPLLLGVSRKSFIGRLLGESDSMENRSWPTVALTAYAAEKGVPLHRVHEVKKNLHALRTVEAIQCVNA